MSARASAQPLADLTAAQAAAAAAAPTRTRSLPIRGTVVRQRHTCVGGHRINYEAAVSEWPVAATDPGSGTVGIVVTESYVATNLPDSHDRPVTFIYNGGPGASSWPLQMEGIGPQIYDAEHGGFRENPDTLLDATDLVFIDPLGTGASFPLDGQDATSLWNTPGDAKATLSVIRAWLENHHRTGAPQYLMGESYGTLRSLAVLHEDASNPKLNVHGVILLSLFLTTKMDADTRAMALLPSFAAAAFAHRLPTAQGLSVETVYQDALAFARTTYAGALAEGYALAEPRLRQVAHETSARTGIPEDLLVSTRLHVTRQQAMHALTLPGEHQHIGSLDARAIGASDLDALPAPYDDPSMSLGRRAPQLMQRYLGSLGYSVAGPYRPLNLSINNQYWYYSTPPSDDRDDIVDGVPWLVDAMKASAHLRLFTAGGYFDIATPVEVGKYLLNHAEIDRARWTAKTYPSGHGITEDVEQRAALARDLRSFITGTEMRWRAK